MEPYYDVAKNCLFKKIRTVSRYMTNAYGKSHKELGITPIQFTMLTAIQILKESNVNKLSSVLTIDRTTLNRNLKPLLREALVSIDESEDKREKVIKITPKGAAIYKEGYEKWKEAQERFKETIGEELYAQLHDVLDKVITVIAPK